MSIKKIIILVITITIIGCGYFGYHSLQNTDSITLSYQHSELSRNQQTSKQKSEVTVPSQVTGETGSEMTSSGVAYQPDESIGFLTSEVFSSPENLDRAFVRSDGAIERSTLSQIFRQNNFDDVVNKIRDVGYDESSLKREALLSDKLKNAFNAPIYHSNHACSGSICTVILQTVGDVSEDELRNLSRFDSNYSFTNTTENELGEKTVFALYIATEDPSTLTITP